MVRGSPFKQSYTALVRAGVVRRPRWLGAVSLVPPQPNLMERTRPPAISFPEDRLRTVFLERNPQVQHMPVDLNTSKLEERHISDRFAALQQRRMEEGATEDEAYRMAYDELEHVITGDTETGRDDGAGEARTVDSAPARAFVASLRYVQRDQRMFEQIKRGEDALTVSQDSGS